MLTLCVAPLIAQTDDDPGIAVPKDNQVPAIAGPPVAPSAVQRPAQPSHIKTGGKYDVTKVGNRGIGGGLNLYSLERERAMGKELATEVESSARLVTDPVITEYVNRIGQTIVRNSDAKVPF